MKYTVIIPVYNAEGYLDECLSSVINQTLKFEKHIEIILVNDGSQDNSEHICLKYKEKYPNNVKYIHIKNSGPSVARNIGLKNVDSKTEYVLFLDSDDKLDENVFYEVEQYFSKYQDINLAVIPVYYFEGLSGPTKLNWRFERGSRVINILDEFYAPQFYIGGTIFKSSILENYFFNEKLNFWEDAIFVNQLILKEGKYGVIANTKYWYRKRNSNDSLVDLSWNSKSRYIDLLNEGYLYILEYSKKLYGHYIPYIQYLVVYHLKLFTFQKNSKILMKVLSEKERNFFVKTVKDLLKKIDKRYILEQDTKNVHKEFLLSLKEGKNIQLCDNINKIDQDNCIKITKKSIKGIKIYLEGYFSDDQYRFKKGDQIFIESLGKRFFAKPKVLNKNLTIWDIIVRDYSQAGFSIHIPICLSFRFGLISQGETFYLKKVNLLHKFARKFLTKIKSGS
jgi:glycosyltransferase involved in cell wall biosynthesis